MAARSAATNLRVHCLHYSRFIFCRCCTLEAFSPRIASRALYALESGTCVQLGMTATRAVCGFALTRLARDENLIAWWFCAGQHALLSTLSLYFFAGVALWQLSHPDRLPYDCLEVNINSEKMLKADGLVLFNALSLLFLQVSHYGSCLTPIASRTTGSTSTTPKISRASGATSKSVAASRRTSRRSA